MVYDNFPERKLKQKRKKDFQWYITLEWVIRSVSQEKSFFFFWEQSAYYVHITWKRWLNALINHYLSNFHFFNKEKYSFWFRSTNEIYNNINPIPLFLYLLIRCMNSVSTIMAINKILQWLMERYDIEVISIITSVFEKKLPLMMLLLPLLFLISQVNYKIYKLSILIV